MQHAEQRVKDEQAVLDAKREEWVDNPRGLERTHRVLLPQFEKQPEVLERTGEVHVEYLFVYVDREKEIEILASNNEWETPDVCGNIFVVGIVRF